MADLLSDIIMRPRYNVRTQAAFVRAMKALTSNRPGEAVDRLPGFNIKTLLRVYDANPSVYVCAMLLLDAGIDTEPDVIRDSKQFRSLVDRLGLQPSSSRRDVKNTHRASLVLLEVFTYMIIINRARKEEEDRKAAAREVASQVYELD